MRSARRRRLDHPNPVYAFRLPLSAFLFLFLSSPIASRADIHYVNVSNAAPVAPYTNWETAATVIQDAIDVSTNGDTVLVADGIYTNGGRAVYGTMTNRVAITKPITLASLNGPEATWIVGQGVGSGATNNGPGAVRCVYLGTNAFLSGFTLTNGHTRTYYDMYQEESGGAVFCEVGGVVSNCTLSGNSAWFYGGGSYSGTLNNCTLSGNSAYYNGGGSYGGTLNNCTLSGNSAGMYGGGSYSGALNNCNLSANSAGSGGAAYYGMLNNCTLSGNSAAYSGGGSCYGTLNNCTLSGNSVNSYGGGSYGGMLNNCALSGNSAGLSGGGSWSDTLNNCTLLGNSAYNHGGGASDSTLNNCIVYYNDAPASPNSAFGTLNYCCTTPASGGTGNITNEPGLVSLAHIAADSPCVGQGSTNYVSGLDIDREGWATPPSIGCDEPYPASATGDVSVAIGAVYTNFSSGFDASFTALIDGAVASNAWDFGDGGGARNLLYASHTWGSTGTYVVVFTAWNADHPSGVAYTTTVSVVAQPVYYINVSNPAPAYPYSTWETAATNIQDAVDAEGIPGPRLIIATNGVYENGSAVVSGVTNRIALTNAVTLTSVNGPDVTIIRGKGPADAGAMRCAYIGPNSVLAGFTLTNGATAQGGGGVYCENGGLVSNCWITGNAAANGGGSYGGTLSNCGLSRNSAYLGGGSYGGTLNGCTLSGNSASKGGGSYGSTLNNCTVSGNSAATYGGGSYGGTLKNCIVYYNSAPIGSNFVSGTLQYCCTAPSPGGTGNITNEPALVSLGHIAATSPCVGNGSTNYLSGLDIDGEAWQAPPSIGCDEPYATGTVSVAIGAPFTTVGFGYNASFTSLIDGGVTSNAWNFGDGTGAKNQVYASHTWGTTGTYAVVLTAWNADHPSGVASTTMVSVMEQVYYVDASNPTPAYPFTSWETAATNIQDAVTAVWIPGPRLVLVTNGVYETGGAVVSGVATTNRIALTNGVTLSSVNGPKVTTIRGKGPVGPAAIRCAYVGSNCVLAGFMLLGGATAQNGGGVYCENGGLVSNCWITGNSAASYGGGACQGTLNNCTLTGNSAATNGGGSYSGILNNCTLFENTAASRGGGSHSSTLYNCIIYYNSAPVGPNWIAGTLSYCCTTPAPGGTGNITNEPGLVWPAHIAADSSCVGKGSAAYASGLDIDGEAWQTPPSIGCDEPYPTSTTGPVSVAIGAPFTEFTVGYNASFTALTDGGVNSNSWDFGDGTGARNQLHPSHTWAATGTYAVVLTAWNADHPTGVVCTTMVSVAEQPVYYVNVSNASPADPYATWETAATNIQDAVSAAGIPGPRLVIVTNGVYDTGGAVVYGTTITNRIALTNAVTVSSVNGPEVTILKGIGPWGPGAVRTAYVGMDCALVGFTLTNGYTKDYRGDAIKEACGGGVWCDPSGFVSNCILVANSAYNYGGGVFGGALKNCILVENTARFYGGAASDSALHHCTLSGNYAGGSGGGAYNCTLNNCIITNNTASQYGGGARMSTLNNCAVAFNYATSGGGGAYNGSLNNCTVIGNSSDQGGGVVCAATNCIIYYNTARIDPNYFQGAYNLLTHSCTAPIPGGVGNITNEPSLLSFDRIAADSPCVGKGMTNCASGTDIDGEPWRSPPSMGADEPYATTATGHLNVAISADTRRVPTGIEVQFMALIDGRATRSAWDFGDGVGLTNSLFARHAWAATNSYPVVLTAWNADHPEGVSSTTMVSVVVQPTYYVNVSNAAPVVPYTNWATAATSIQQAISAGSGAGRLILVTNGVYESGGTVVEGLRTNRVALTAAMTVRSINGPGSTVIKGTASFGSDGVRCAYVEKDCVLAGFTLTNGFAESSADFRLGSGGGALCELGGKVSNCVILANAAYNYGGGVSGGISQNCILIGNSAAQGGGAARSSLKGCTVKQNTGSHGGGTLDCDLVNCLVINNSAQNYGGVSGGSATNCTLAFNSAQNTFGGGASCRFYNSIIYFNTAPNYENLGGGAEANYTCSIPLAQGYGNITNAPQFITPEAGDYRLAPTSPCIGAGINQEWMFDGTDLAGSPRILNGTVDMGAYETPFTLSLRALLEGPYRTNAHAMVAGNPAAIPLTSPYATDPRAVSAIPSNVVDWVLVELVGTNGNTVVSKSAFLDTGGYLLSSDGGTGITAEVSAGYYSVVLRHRNHLSAMSSAPVAFTNILTTYDFTTGSDRYLGGAASAVELEANAWGLIAGDADGDGAILGADAGIYSNQVGQVGYHRGDFNLDGTVDGEDLAFLSVNQGLQSGASGAGTPLGGGLAITPQRKTVVSGASFTLTALGTSNSVNWAFVESPSGGSLSPSTITSAVYTAGPTSNCVDVVQAQEGDRLGRAWVNVISSNDVAGAGRAIVIAGGKGPNDPLRDVTDYLADLAYNTLLYRGFSKDNVRYLNPDPNQDVDGNGLADDVASATTMSSAAGAFTNWAMAGTDRLFVYLVDHGGTTSGEGYFRLNGGETLTATQLDGWLDGIQAGNERELVVVLDFCESGSFLDPLKGPRRTVIAACGPSEPTYFVAGGLVSFSDAFFGAVISGQDLAGAFALARDAMGAYQGALLDTDGNGLYEADKDLTSTAVVGVYLGPSFIAGKDIPQIGHVMGGQMLQGDTAATLWAYDIASAYPIDRVWCVLVPPGHEPDPQDPVADLPTLDLAYNSATGRYEARYGGFAELGTYKLIYYARDIWGSASLPRASFVEQAGYRENLVLVAGGSTNDPGWSAVANLAAYAYQTALARRLGKPALRYLSAGPPQDIDGDGTNDVYAAATLSNLEESITLWPTNANRLSVYLLGSSTTNGLCRLNPAESLPASQLDGWLDSFQASNTAALVVMDFDGCGGYVPELKPPPERERIVVASAKAGAPRLCALDGVYSFSRFFLSGILNGKSVGAAFASARDAVKSASGKLRQSPQLDDSGNGVPDEKKLDGALASTRYLGAAFATGADAPFIGAVNPDGLVVAGQPVLLWASNVLADAGISSVWCAVTAPDYDGTGDPPRVDLPWSEANGRYEALSTNFVLPGEYACTFFASDTNGALSAPVQSLLIAGDAYEPDGTNSLATIFPTEEVQLHSIHVSGDEDWVLFYAPTGFAFNIDATQLGTNSDLVLEVYYELPDGSLESVYGEPENGYGTGSNVTERIVLDLKANLLDLEPGIYFVRVGSADTNLFGPGSDYALEIYEPVGGSGGVTLLSYPGPLFQYGTFVVFMSPSNAAAAGAAWRVQEQGGTWRSDNKLYSLPIPDSGDWHLEFRDAAGFSAPADQALSLLANRTVTNSAAYAPVLTYTTLLSRAVGMSLDPAGGGVFSLTCPGYPGQDCAFEESTNLLQWVPVATNTVPEDGTLRSYITNNPARPRVFYRWHRIQ